MKTIGITGGIGSGKTLACKVFQTLGIPIFDSDNYAKKVYEEYPETVEMLKKRYGDKVLTGGKLDRSKLAAIVFESEEELRALNELVHPFVKQQFEHWRQLQDAPYIIREAAILFESGSYADCDSVILVTAPQELRIQRAMQRDLLDEKHVLARISRQWGDDQKRKLSDFEIINDDKRAILPQIISIHEHFLRG